MGGAGRSQRAAGGDLQRPSAAAVVTNVNASHRRRRHLRCATVVDARIVGVGGHAVVPVPGRGPVAGAAGPVGGDQQVRPTGGAGGIEQRHGGSGAARGRGVGVQGTTRGGGAGRVRKGGGGVKG